MGDMENLFTVEFWQAQWAFAQSARWLVIPFLFLVWFSARHHYGRWRASPNKWEYSAIAVKNIDARIHREQSFLQNDLNDMGDMGWELVTIEERTEGLPFTEGLPYIAIFKRPKIGQ